MHSSADTASYGQESIRRRVLATLNVAQSTFAVLLCPKPNMEHTLTAVTALKPSPQIGWNSPLPIRPANTPCWAGAPAVDGVASLRLPSSMPAMTTSPSPMGSHRTATPNAFGHSARDSDAHAPEDSPRHRMLPYYENSNVGDRACGLRNAPPLAEYPADAHTVLAEVVLTKEPLHTGRQVDLTELLLATTTPWYTELGGGSSARCACYVLTTPTLMTTLPVGWPQLICNPSLGPHAPVKAV